MIVALALLTTSGAAGASAPAVQLDIRGAWHPEEYHLKDGSRYDAGGLIFFTESDWTVLFFVLDDDGTPQRGSGEGGTYSLEGDSLVFTHLYNLSAGNEYGSFPETPVRFAYRGPADAPTEECRVEIDADRMTIHFPSGNHIIFRRSSR
jgi:hypothetical protein